MTNHPNRAKSSEIAVVVTTQHRGVFFGYADQKKIKDEILSLRAARNCLYWPRENQGFMGLAAKGPTSGARVGPAADIDLRDITSVMRCSDEATKAWEAAPWSK